MGVFFIIVAVLNMNILNSYSSKEGHKRLGKYSKKDFGSLSITAGPTPFNLLTIYIDAFTAINIKIPPQILYIFKINISHKYWVTKRRGWVSSFTLIGDNYVPFGFGSDSVPLFQFGWGICWSYNNEGNNDYVDRKCYLGRLTINLMWLSVADNVLTPSSQFECNPKKVGMNIKFTPFESVSPSGYTWGINWGTIDVESLIKGQWENLGSSAFVSLEFFFGKTWLFEGTFDVKIDIGLPRKKKRISNSF